MLKFTLIKYPKAMSVHVNEYDPRSKNQTRGIQTDPYKLKFNNIQSCIAVVLCVFDNDGHRAPTINRLIGVHINTSNLGNNEMELNIALSQLKQDGDTLIDIYLVGPYDDKYAGTRLAEKLKYLDPRSIKLFNLTPIRAGWGANQDVKVEANGDTLNVYYRDCVKVNQDLIKDRYNPNKGGVKYTNADLAVGRHKYVNDRDQKPWKLAIAFRDLLTE
jgi:hypothetical protein